VTVRLLRVVLVMMSQCVGPCDCLVVKSCSCDDVAVCWSATVENVSSSLRVISSEHVTRSKLMCSYIAHLAQQ